MHSGGDGRLFDSFRELIFADEEDRNDSKAVDLSMLTLQKTDANLFENSLDSSEEECFENETLMELLISLDDECFAFTYVSEKEHF